MAKKPTATTYTEQTQLLNFGCNKPLVSSTGLSLTVLPEKLQTYGVLTYEAWSKYNIAMLEEREFGVNKESKLCWKYTQ